MLRHLAPLLIPPSPFLCFHSTTAARSIDPPQFDPPLDFSRKNERYHAHFLATTSSAAAKQSSKGLKAVKALKTVDHAIKLQPFCKRVSKPINHLLTISSLTPLQIQILLKASSRIKKTPAAFTSILTNHTLLLLFSKPSLRTRLSFETAMTQLGGSSIYYPLDTNAPLGKKESIEDTAKVIGRYVSVMAARLNTRNEINKLAQNCPSPVINALDDWGHPCQILADLLTIREHKPHLKLNEMRIAYVGDVNNNVTFDLIRACSMLGIELSLGGPSETEFEIPKEILQEYETLLKDNGRKLHYSNSAIEAVRGADVVMTDSWFSYHLSTDPDVVKQRHDALKPFQVNTDLMQHARKDAIFMHCLPAKRGEEVTEAVIDGPQSVVFDEAENRLHVQKAILLFLMNKLDWKMQKKKIVHEIQTGSESKAKSQPKNPKE